MCFHLPRGISVTGLELQNRLISPLTSRQEEDGSSTVSFACQLRGRSLSPWGRIYLRADNGCNERSEVQCWLDFGDGGPRSVVKKSCQRSSFKEIPPLKRLTFGLTTWPLTSVRRWPDSLNAIRRIGLNTIAVHEDEVSLGDEESLAQLAAAREQGLQVLHFVSAFHGIVSRHPDDSEIFCQGATGPLGGQLCPSYRGKWYAEELNRLAVSAALLKPDYISADIELWDWAGPASSPSCTRCRADMSKSAIADRAQWLESKGFEMWSDLYRRVQAAAAAMGRSVVGLGGYDFRPGEVYQRVWPFDRLWAAGLTSGSQRSYYTPLGPYHQRELALQLRKDRLAVGRASGLPWITPGDSGTVSADQIRQAVLESVMNGALGVQFWSERYWDGETILGLHRALRALQPVEQSLLNGAPSNAVTGQGWARIASVQTSDEIVTLVSRDVSGNELEEIRVQLSWPATVDDPETGEILGTLEVGERLLPVNIGDSMARIIRFRKNSQSARP